jgi:hypothetical protein
MAGCKNANRVLVGTYRPENEAWIRERRLYNLPLPEFSRALGRAGAPHAEFYAIYELIEESTPAKLLGGKSAEVFVASSRCPCVKIDETFYSKPYPITGGKSMQYVFDCLKPYFRKWKSATTFNPVQEDFFRESFGFDYGLQEAKEIANDAKEKGQGIDLLAGGVPCPPFSVASKQLGEDDERDLFPQAIRLISEMRPRAVMLENVRGFLDPKFELNIGNENSI